MIHLLMPQFRSLASDNLLSLIGRGFSACRINITLQERKGLQKHNKKLHRTIIPIQQANISKEAPRTAPKHQAR
jgi:hypothetical protein